MTAWLPPVPCARAAAGPRPQPLARQWARHPATRTRAVRARGRSGRQRADDLNFGQVQGVGEKPGQQGHGGDQVVDAELDPGCVCAVFVAPQGGPVALEEWVVAPDRLLGPAGQVDVTHEFVGEAHGFTCVPAYASFKAPPLVAGVCQNQRDSSLRSKDYPCLVSRFAVPLGPVVVVFAAWWRNLSRWTRPVGG